MPQPLPTPSDIAALLAFLPAFERPGRTFIQQWHGGRDPATGIIQLPVPTYDDDVQLCFDLLSAPPWSDPDYDPSRCALLLADPAAVSSATLADVRALLTYCVRGERVCDGHWGGLLKSGVVISLLKRLQQLPPPEPLTLNSRMF